MARKEDQRTRMTKKLIEESFIDVLSKKPLANISVKEVCEKAMVNRSTFYSYYEDIYDLYNNIKQTITETIVGSLDNITKIDKNFNFYDEIFKYLKENESVVKIFVGLQVDNEFIMYLLKICEDTVYKIYKHKYILINEERFRNYFTFASNGVIGIINKWILDGMKEDYHEIAKITEAIAVKGIKYLY